MWGLPKLTPAASAVLAALRGARRSERSGREQAPSDVLEHETLVGLAERLPRELLLWALTHSSWVSERTGSYERLEFLGDSVLGLAIAAALFERHPEKEEGDLARMKAFVVSRASCVEVAKRIGVGRLILEYGPASQQKREEAADSRSILGNMLEALIGACFIGHGYERTAAAVASAFDEQMTFALTGHVDYKTTLQERLAPRGRQPGYRVVGEEGPAHARRFTSEVSVDGKVVGRGAGTTIKMSEQQAAREALAALESESKEL